jgi:hypothetical protein
VLGVVVVGVLALGVVEGLEVEGALEFGVVVLGVVDGLEVAGVDGSGAEPLGVVGVLPEDVDGAGLVGVALAGV